jgi:hypothetical protein
MFVRPTHTMAPTILVRFASRWTVPIHPVKALHGRDLTSHASFGHPCWASLWITPRTRPLPSIGLTALASAIRARHAEQFHLRPPPCEPISSTRAAPTCHRPHINSISRTWLTCQLTNHPPAVLL